MADAATSANGAPAMAGEIVTPHRPAGADRHAQYQPKIVGGGAHEEYWIPAEALEALNDAIVGGIKVVARFERGGEP